MGRGRAAKSATMRDVAELAGVALTTVSRAYSDAGKLSPETLLRIESAASELGYTVNLNARSLRRKASGQLLVLLPDIGNPFFSIVLKGLEEGAREGGRLLLIGDTGADATLADRYAGQLAVGAVDGLVLLDGRVPFAPRSRERSRLLLLPIVALSERVEEMSVPFVGIDNVRAARDVAHHLADLGHARVAEIAGPDGNSLTGERSRGFAAGAAERGLAVVGRVSGDFSLQAGERGAHALLSRTDRPSAIFAANDSMAMGAIRAAAAAGLSVPDDLSVVGFDDIDFAAIHAPALTTVRQPRLALGRAAVAVVTARIEGHPAPAQSLILGHDIVVRDSVGPPRRMALRRRGPRLAAANPT